MLPGEERSHAVWFPPKKKENTPVAVAPQRRILSAKNASQHAAAASPRKGWAPGGGAAALAGGGPVGHTRYNGYNGCNGNRGVTDRGGSVSQGPPVPSCPHAPLPHTKRRQAGAVCNTILANSGAMAY